MFKVHYKKYSNWQINWQSNCYLIRYIGHVQQSKPLNCWLRKYEYLQIFWSETGELVCIATEDSFFILKYNAEAVENAKETKDGITEDGIEDAFEVGRIM